MKLLSILTGIAMTSMLLAVLVVTRLMDFDHEPKEYVVRDIDIATLPEPEEPAPVSDPQPEATPPPPPSVADLAPSLDLSQPAIPLSTQPIPPNFQVVTFHTDQPPSPLPVIKKQSPPKVVTTPKPKVPTPKVTPTPPKPKSFYTISELDRKPRLLRNPSVTFPRSIRNASQGEVMVKVKISPNGKSQLVSIISTSHPQLTPLANRIANGSRFTTPTRQGKPVTAVMTWPIVIKK